MENQHTRIIAALDDRDYVAAERLIRATTDPHVLNQPNTHYDIMIPLTRVLTHEHINLYLAKLLVEMGASPNTRLESPYYAMPAAPSPMEMLVLVLTNVSVLEEEELVAASVVGMHNQPVTNLLDFRRELMELLDLFLGHGGDPNVTTTNKHMTVYHQSLARSDLDMEVVTKLCQAGGNLNLTNSHGTTPLMDLLKHSRGDKSLALLAEIEMTQENVQPLLLNVENCQNETTLWNASLAGSPGMVMELLKRGADASCCHKSVTIPLGMLHNVSPLLAPLLRESFPYKMFTSVGHKVPPAWSVALMNKVISYAISPIIDTFPASICFPLEAVSNLQRLTARLTKFKKECLYSTNVNVSDVPVLMFGRLNAGLQQLCVKVVMEQVMAVGSRDVYSVESLNSTTIEALVAELGLPSVLVTPFAIEAARLQSGSALFKAKANSRCQSGCEDLSANEDSSFSDASSVLTVTSNEESSESSLDWSDHSGPLFTT